MLLLNRNTHITATTGTPVPPGANHDGFLLGRYKTSNSYVMLAGYLPRHQRSICSALGLNQYASFSGSQFAASADEIEQAVSLRLLEKTSLAWDAVFAEEGVVAGGVRDLAEVMATGQPEARELLSEVETEVGSMQVTNAGYRINDRVFRPSASVPLLGEHSREILKQSGLDSQTIDDLIDKGVVVAN